MPEVRKALSTDHQRVKAFLGGLQSLEFGGRARCDSAFACSAHELLSHHQPPEGNDLVRDVDPRFGLHAFSACTMMSLRKSLRNGRPCSSAV